ncbi:MAG: hypothetical protein KGZ34_05045 [Nitrosarchaeum sp.]|nr:hypothetical protein [Nitrosarchaeum sp.]
MITTRNLAMLLLGIATISVGVLSTPNTAEAMSNESSGVLGHITLIVADSDGNIKNYVQTDNLVTDVGKDCIVERTFGTTVAGCTDGATFNNIGLGTGTGQTATSSNVATPLGAGCVRVAASTNTETGTATETVTIKAIFGGSTSTGADVTNAACQATITEAGLFNSATAATGEMFSYQSFTGVAIGASDTLSVQWDIAFSG